MAIAAFDHAAVPAGKPRELIAFYGALGFGVPDAEQWLATNDRKFEVRFGPNKINFHAPRLWQDKSFTLKGPSATPGCGDFCFVWDGTVAELQATLAKANAEIVEGPCPREGGRGPGTSIYTRDPDGNLLEFIVYG
ncbi:VOC family protein [Ramlibacter sp.]|uniref:VOC family protein n=1 Tax=Ramlibacter sp. TaxID=1917967 RepID=UPI003D0D0DC8